MVPLERLTTARPDQELSDVLDVMGQTEVNQLPVVENGRLLDIITRDSILTFWSGLARRQKKTPGSRRWASGLG